MEGSSGNIIFDFKQTWKKFDGAGSHLLYGMCSSLAGSQYEGLTKELLAVLGPVFGCAESELVLGRLIEMENLLSGLHNQQRTMGSGGKDGKSSYVQMVCRCLLLFVKLLTEYHQLCYHALTSVIDHLVSFCEHPDNRDLLHHLKSLDLHKYTSLRHSPTRTSTSAQKKGLNSGSPKSHKHGSFKASLFSLFERKNSPDECNSSFYVDIEQQTKDDHKGADINKEVLNNQSETIPDGHVTIDRQSDLIKFDMNSDIPEKVNDTKEGNINPEDDTSEKNTDSETMVTVDKEDTTEILMPYGASGNNPVLNTAKNITTDINIPGQVATQEELDSVINLLSGASIGLATMQTIPEHRDQLTLRVPSLHSGSLSPATHSDMYVMEEAVTMPRTKSLQRHSEGSLDLSGFSTPGHNTWPYHHRSSLPGGQLAPSILVPPDVISPQLPHHYGNNVRPTTLPPGGAAHFHTAAYNWGFPDPKLNRTWPVNNLTGTGRSVTGTLNSSWSGAHDSDDLSDDSSCGDQFHTMTQLQNMEHSSMYHDECMTYKKSDDGGGGGGGGEVKHHSLEDLLDGRSHTWPQQLQPWSQSHGLDLVGGHDTPPGYHRPITMQLSDPLTRQTMWQNTGEDLPHQNHSHSIQSLGQM